MRNVFVALAALACLAVSTPASAQHWGHHRHHGFWGGPHFGLSIGVPVAPYAYACDTLRVRHVTPRGHVVYRYIRRC
jgi:hypothetical protein